MPEELNLLNPYSFTNNDFNYTFITDSGVQYSAYFLAATYFDIYPELNDLLMSFGFSPRENKAKALFLDNNCNLRRQKKIDFRVRDTIITIMDAFLTKHPTKAIISICDNKDARERCRHKLFNDWYDKISNMKYTSIVKYNMDIHGIETFYGHASLIIRKDHALHENLKSAFININESLISKGY